MFRSRSATLDDWLKVRDFYRDFKESHWGSRIDVPEEEFEQWFLSSLLRPSEVGVVLVENECGNIVAMAVLQATLMYTQGKGYRPHTFVRGVYVDYPRAGKQGGDLMHQAMLDWGRQRGHEAIYGHVRDTFRLKAVERRYGYRLWNLVVGRPLEEEEKSDG